MANRRQRTTLGEYIEIYNWGTAPADLQNYKLFGNSLGRHGPYQYQLIVPAGGYVLLGTMEYGYERRTCARLRVHVSTGTNTGDRIVLKDPRWSDGRFGGLTTRRRRMPAAVFGTRLPTTLTWAAPTATSTTPTTRFATSAPRKRRTTATYHTDTTAPLLVACRSRTNQEATMRSHHSLTEYCWRSGCHCRLRGRSGSAVRDRGHGTPHGQLVFDADNNGLFTPIGGDTLLRGVRVELRERGSSGSSTRRARARRAPSSSPLSRPARMTSSWCRIRRSRRT